MRHLSIAVSEHRESAKVKHLVVSWERLAKKLTEIKRTTETAAEYAAAPKDRQLEIKDVGSFVGGKFRGDTRRKDELEYRSVVALDLDHANGDVEGLVSLAYGEREYVLHSTHKHTSASPRLRLVFPLTRDITLAEYEPIARAIAEWLGMDTFDDTTYQPARVMFWPSASSDAPVVSVHNAGEWINPDKVLEGYAVYGMQWDNPRDWPLSSRATTPRRSDQTVEYAPGKKGIIGAFCRTFDIHRAIAEFELPYEETNSETRYSFEGGSSSQGAVVYDFDTQLFSHHESDPAHGLHNSWDLVRLHRFATLDEGVPEGTSLSRLPSHQALVALCVAEYPEVAAELESDKPEITFEDISGETAHPSPLLNVDSSADVPTLTTLERFRDAIDNAQDRVMLERITDKIAANYDMLSGVHAKTIV